jgi:glycosyltransferase involved in cell wall biosynthesis
MSAPRPTLYVVAVNPRDLEASFIRAHIERLPADTVAVHGYLPAIGERSVLSPGLAPRALRKVQRLALRQPWSEEITRGYVEAFTRRPAAVLAEYGPTGVRVIDACRRAGLPLVVHFHGYDASVRTLLDEHRQSYPRLFEAAAAIIAVSRAMREQLIGLGAPAGKVHYCPYGVDCDRFTPAAVAAAPPVALAVGRLVDKKAPHLTILAFARARREVPSATLRIIGDGPLMGPCLDLAAALGIADAVTFLGQQPHAAICAEMQNARVFVQHSVQAINGDCEGTPNAVIEAGASGLPVVATRHAGIPDVVIEGETGWLVDERDADGMGRRMAHLLADPAAAGGMGRAARRHVTRNFSVEGRLAGLWAVIEAAIAGRQAAGVTGETSRRAAAFGS